MKPSDIGNPPYPDLGAKVMKFRRVAAKGGLMDMPKAQRNAYADAIEDAIRTKQRQELQRELPSHNVSCASGTNHNDGAAISAAVRAQHRAALLAAPSKERKARTPEKWRKMYDAAMADKRARAAANVVSIAPRALPEENADVRNDG